MIVGNEIYELGSLLQACIMNKLRSRLQSLYFGMFDMLIIWLFLEQKCFSNTTYLHDMKNFQEQDFCSKNGQIVTMSNMSK